MLDQAVRSKIAALARTGAYGRDDLIEQFTLERYEPGELDDDEVAAEVEAQFAAHAAEQKNYPATTDCDRLDAAFAAMNARGVLALQNAGSTQSDGFEEVKAAARARTAGGGERPVGYCFYHGQDLERAAAGGPLYSRSARRGRRRSRPWGRRSAGSSGRSWNEPD